MQLKYNRMLDNKIDVILWPKPSIVNCVIVCDMK